MSAQFGKCNFDGKPVDPKDFEQVRPALAPFGPDGEGFICQDNFAILYRALHTTKESRIEAQPHRSISGVIITWDGRLDNRLELADELKYAAFDCSADLLVVAAAYECWGTDCLRKLVGDWALSIWNPNDRTLVLARDFAGTRPLFYLVENHRGAWSTVLDFLIPCTKRPLVIDYEYLAGWLTFFPASHLTPYVGIHSVPPSSFVTLSMEKHDVHKYWDFSPNKRFSYKTDREYEEHFRAVFSDSVRRRLRSDHPVLAELSGGVDSSSIVCMADKILTNGVEEHCQLRTVSYYDDSEPHWNERPYFTAVEQQRGRAGCHINVTHQSPAEPEFDRDSFSLIPGCNGGRDEASKQFAAHILSLGSRIVLSGNGGDEIMGGVPTPIPELSDLIARAELKKLVHQLRAWALDKRKPWFHLLSEAMRGFLPLVPFGLPEHLRPPAWLHPEFVKKYRKPLTGYPKRLTVFGSLPSFQENLSSLDTLRRQLGCAALPCCPPYEKRYPYLDRDLLEFIFGIPREQLVRPGQRRSLMRRALAGVVPDEVLNRRRKAFVIRSPLQTLSLDFANLRKASQQIFAGNLGILSPVALRQAIENAPHQQNPPVLPMIRLLRLERWFRHLAQRGLLERPATMAAGIVGG